METPSGATTDTTSGKPDGGTSTTPGAESPPAAAGASENDRINELTGNWRESQRNAEHFRGRTETLERELAAERAKNAKAGDAKPAGSDTGGDDEEVKTLADFKYDEKAYGKYLRDLGRKDAERAADKVRTEIKEGRTQAERDEQVNDFQDKARSWATEQKLDNIEKMFASPAEGGPAISDSMAEAIMTSDQGPAILNYLARNTAESRRIHKLTPVQQAREIGRLEAKFAAGPAQTTVSGAPPPPPQVRGASDTGAAKKDPAQMTDTEWYADQQRRQKAARKAS